MKVISWRCATSCARVSALCEPCESPSMGVPVRGRLGGLCHQASVTNRSGFRWLLCLLSSLVLCIWVISWKKVRILDLRFVVLIKQLMKEKKEKVNIVYTSCFYATYCNLLYPAIIEQLEWSERVFYSHSFKFFGVAVQVEYIFILSTTAPY